MNINKIFFSKDVKVMMHAIKNIKKQAKNRAKIKIEINKWFIVSNKQRISDKLFFERIDYS